MNMNIHESAEFAYVHTSGVDLHRLESLLSNGVVGVSQTRHYRNVELLNCVIYCVS